MIHRLPFPQPAGGLIGMAYRHPTLTLTEATVNGYHEPRPDTLTEWHAIPWAGVEYCVAEADLLQEASKTFGLDRLAGVHQIDKKSHPLLPYQFPFPMHRFGHSFDVAALHALLMGKEEGRFSEREIRSGIVASLLHDLLTAAGGEKTKIQNLSLFDEDANFGGFLESKAWKNFAHRHGLDTRLVHDVILETSLPGKLKDIADKIAYTSRDSHALLSLLKRSGAADYGPYERIVGLIREHPDISTIWQDVEIIEGRMVFTDPDALARFLLLRALMSDLVYQNTATRRAAYIFDEVMVRFLFDSGRLSRDDLLAMTDADLDELVDQFIQFETMQSDPLWREFATRAEAEAFEQDLISRGIIFSVLEDVSHAPQPATGLLVLTDEGLQPLRDALPQQAREVEETCRHARWIKVGWLEQPLCQLKTGVHEQIQRSRRRRHKLAC